MSISYRTSGHPDNTVQALRTTVTGTVEIAGNFAFTKRPEGLVWSFDMIR